jgi:hypothetical protein
MGRMQRKTSKGVHVWTATETVIKKFRKSTIMSKMKKKINAGMN